MHAKPLRIHDTADRERPTNTIPVAPVELDRPPPVDCETTGRSLTYRVAPPAFDTITASGLLVVVCP